jgi:uncharacterized protein (DUF2342 family)
MSDAEMNKTMEFIVEQQAKFAAEIEIMREVQAADAKRLGDGLIGVIDIVGQLAQSQMRTVETVNSLTEDFKRLTQAQARTEEAQARTEEHLTILLTVVEGHISGNGGSHSHP